MATGKGSGRASVDPGVAVDPKMDPTWNQNRHQKHFKNDLGNDTEKRDDVGPQNGTTVNLSDK